MTICPLIFVTDIKKKCKPSRVCLYFFVFGLKANKAKSVITNMILRDHLSFTLKCALLTGRHLYPLLLLSVKEEIQNHGSSDWYLSLVFM